MKKPAQPVQRKDQPAAAISQQTPAPVETLQPERNLFTERKEAEAALREKEEWFRTVFENASDGLFFLTPGGEIVSVNKSFAAMHGYSVAEILKMNLKDLDASESNRLFPERMRRILAGESLTFEVERHHKNGRLFPLEVTASLVTVGGKKYILAAHRDITGRRRVETELRRANRAMRMISLCNQEMVRATDETALLQTICQIAVKHGGYRMAWVGFAEQDEARSVRPVAQAGFEEGYLDTVDITWADAERGRGPTGSAIRTGQPVLARNILTDPAFVPWRVAAIQRGYASSVALPLRGGDRCFGALMIYAAEPDAFDADEVKLLDELAGDLAYGIGALRHRAERERAEAALNNERELWRTLLDTSPDHIYFKDTQSRFIKSSKAQARQFGVKSPDEMVGRTDFDFFTEAHARPAFEDEQEIIRTGRPMIAKEEREVWNDGHVTWASSTKMPMRDATGKIIGIMGISRDITGRKRADEALRRSREEFKDLFDNAPVGFHELDTDGRIVRINQTELKMLGYSAEELLGQFIWKLSTEEETSRRTVLAKLAGEMPPSEGFERLFRRKDGSTFPVFIIDRMLKREDGAIIGLHGAVQDITERKQAVQRVTDALNFNQTMLRASPVGIVVFKAAGPCISTNEVIEQIIGGPRETVLKQNFRQLESWKHSGMLAAAEAALATQTERKLETQVLTTFGRKIWCSCRFAPFQYEGEPHLLLLIGDITERKQAEMALQESRQMLRSVLDNIPVRVFWKDTEGRFLGSNQPFAGDAGFGSPEALIGRNDHDMGWKDQADLYRADDRQVIASGIPKLQYEEPQTTPAGTRLWLRTSKIPLRDLEGRIIGILGTYEDITERKRAEEEVARTAREWQATFDATKDAIWILDPNHQVLRSNKAAEQFFHRPCSEMIGKPCWEIVHGTTEPVPDCPFVRSRQSGQRETMDLQIGERWFEVIVDPIFDATGQYAGAVHIVSDITGRKQAEERIREQAAMLDAANDAIYVCTLDHTVTYWNDAAERLCGWARAEALGRKITELGGVDREAFETAHAALLEQGSWTGELKWISKAGKEFVVFCRWTVLPDEQGRPKEILAINTDVTEKKKFEAQYLRAQRMEGIGALAGGIAHDLNNILQPILMTAPLLRETTADPESREMLDTVENCAQRGADIIKQLLTFARGEPSARVPLPVRHLLNEMNKLIQETFPKNIQLRVNVPQNLWQVLGDATQIHQALMNLCVNARDAMSYGGTLTLAAENLTLDEAFAAMMPGAKPGPYVCVSVADTGMGIPPENLDRIFDPFFTTKEIGKGTGLGLATVLGIARGHGGFVRVNSQTGKGTTFDLYLPASLETKTAALPERETLPPRAGGELILVVDDEASVRGVVQHALEKHGYRVVPAAEWAEAMGLFARHRAEIRAVLTDMMMPEMDGPSLVRALRHLEPQLPILGMTGVGEKADIKGLETLDLLVLLTKPFNSIALLGVLHQALAAPRPAKGKPQSGGPGEPPSLVV
jgi:PAS domain S-box-containing protein